MLDLAVRVAGLLVLLAIVAFLHELGHYYAGRRITGIPGEDITLVLAAVPPHVALRDDDGAWVSPTEYDRYWSIYDDHDPEREHAERFMAAGDIVQGGVVVPVALVLAFAGFADVAFALVVLSLLVILLQVLYDAALTLSANQPRGDYSALWQVSPRAPVTLLAGFVLIHLGTFEIIV
ncbi:MAG: hypothetical protein V5A55_00790 [Halovenus sp.]